ncbi:trans-aconitate 2-methyltransferase [Streptomyces sp. ODS05-4]|uniref:class I SAM-dependent methyltransferase n=1 Tax=Streptomyces sp. ODS05-4 TaxID=2944939 RepID=UPI00210957F4|nr:class I SAM-dependent methyltransferase [Streptomyces sp. ODS05-4]
MADSLDNGGTGSFQTAWEDYWQKTFLLTKPNQDAESIWDIDVDRAAVRDFHRFAGEADLSLPLLDLGCGNGLQTQTLAQQYPGRPVVGADVSEAAVNLAALRFGSPGLEYRTLDVLDGAAVAAFHEEFGDVNLYIRTLLHFIQADRRPLFVDAVETLIGERGRLYLWELGAEAPAYFSAWIERNGMPRDLERVLTSGVRPGSVTREQIIELFPEGRFTRLQDGDDAGTPVPKVLAGPDGQTAAEPWAPPCYWVVVKTGSAPVV